VPATESNVPAHPDGAAPDLASEYARMAADAGREADARAWADALLPDVSDEEE
jgi:hypothetical protein